MGWSYMSKLKHLKVAGIFVVILLGLSTLVVGIQLSSDSTATTVPQADHHHASSHELKLCRDITGGNPNL